jgi:RNA polymerase sigma-70 factor, ECF subfamily
LGHNEPCKEDLPHRLATSVDLHFEEFVLTYQEDVYRYALGLTHNHELAEDIRQEVFLRMYNMLKNATAEHIGKMHFPNYLRAVTKKVCSGEWGRRKKCPTVPSSPEIEDLLAKIEDTTIGSPEEQALVQERKNELIVLIEQLPKRWRPVVFCRYIQELTLIEIAERLQMPYGTVQSYLNRAREKLFEMLTVDQMKK